MVTIETLYSHMHCKVGLDDYHYRKTNVILKIFILTQSEFYLFSLLALLKAYHMRIETFIYRILQVLILFTVVVL